MRLTTTIAGTDLSVIPEAHGPVLSWHLSDQAGIRMEATWQDVRVLADTLLQALAEAGEAMPVEHVDGCEGSVLPLPQAHRDLIRAITHRPTGPGAA